MSECVCVCRSGGGGAIQVWFGIFVSLYLNICVFILYICVLMPSYVSSYLTSINTQVIHKMDHLACFVGGMFVLGMRRPFFIIFFYIFFLFYFCTRGSKYAGTCIEVCGRICLACWWHAGFLFLFFSCRRLFVHRRSAPYAEDLVEHIKVAKAYADVC